MAELSFSVIVSPANAKENRPLLSKKKQLFTSMSSLQLKQYFESLKAPNWHVAYEIRLEDKQTVFLIDHLIVYLEINLSWDFDACNCRPLTHVLLLRR